MNVSRVLLAPSASIDQRSQFENSEVQRVYAIRVPAALKSGWVSIRCAEFVRFLVPVTPAKTIQMSDCAWIDRLNAISPLRPGNAACAVGASETDSVSESRTTDHASVTRRTSTTSVVRGAVRLTRPDTRG